jgi:hypothetical protein
MQDHHMERTAAYPLLFAAAGPHIRLWLLTDLTTSAVGGVKQCVGRIVPPMHKCHLSDNTLRMHYSQKRYNKIVSATFCACIRCLQAWCVADLGHVINSLYVVRYAFVQSECHSLIS